MRTALFAAASLVLLSILGAAQASAETQPRSIGADPRIKQYTYSKDTVYRLDLALKFITSIEFARGEAIDSVLMGDSESWQVIRLQSGNVLAVKPLIGGWGTLDDLERPSAELRQGGRQLVAGIAAIGEQVAQPGEAVADLPCRGAYIEPCSRGIGHVIVDGVADEGRTFALPAAGSRGPQSRLGEREPWSGGRAGTVKAVTAGRATETRRGHGRRATSRRSRRGAGPGTSSKEIAPPRSPRRSRLMLLPLATGRRAGAAMWPALRSLRNLRSHSIPRSCRGDPFLARARRLLGRGP